MLYNRQPDNPNNRGNKMIETICKECNESIDRFTNYRVNDDDVQDYPFDKYCHHCYESKEVTK